MTPPALSLTWLFFSFQGRIARRSFALSLLFLLFPQLVLVLQMVRYGNNDAMLALFGFALMGIWVAVLWSVMALSAKRLHDLGVTGWLALIAFFPAISWLFFLALAVLPSNQKTNEYGPPPFPVTDG